MTHKSQKSGLHRAAFVALGSLLVMAALLSACSTAVRSESGTRSHATSRSHSRTTAPGRGRTVSPQAHAETIAGTPGTDVVLETTVITLTSSAHLNFSGSGFSPGETLQISIADAHGKTELNLTPSLADAAGDIAPVSFVMASGLAPGPHVLIVKGEASQHVGTAEFQIALIPPTVQLDTYTAKPGYAFGVSGGGFAAGEAVDVFLGTTTGKPLATLSAGAGGNLMGRISVPVRPAGEYTLYFVGRASNSPATVGFNVQGFKPWVVLENYAPRAGSALSISGQDFGPNERVLVYLNTARGQPKTVIQVDSQGTFTHARGFVIPSTMTGHQTLIFIGEHSRVQTTASFDIFPSAGSDQPPAVNP
jgi:hypothetical protein